MALSKNDLTLFTLLMTLAFLKTGNFHEFSSPFLLEHNEGEHFLSHTRQKNNGLKAQVEYEVDVELNVTDAVTLNYLKSLLSNGSFSLTLGPTVNVTHIDITTVCYPNGSNFQCRCEGQYVWSYRNCIIYGACDEIIDDTCTCINSIPYDGQYCQPKTVHPVVYEYQIFIEVNTTDADQLRNTLKRSMFPVQIGAQISISSADITTVCRQSDTGFQCRCEDEYIWPCEKCATYEKCDSNTNNTCKCIKAIPTDGQYCQSSHHQTDVAVCPLTTSLPSTAPPALYEYLISIELTISDVAVINELRTILSNISYPISINNHTQISDLNISTVCSPSSGGYQCRCEDQYRWSCDQCLTFGACDNIMNNTCGCISTIPPDGQYCQSVSLYNFTYCPVTPTPAPALYEYLISIELTISDVAVINELRTILSNISYPISINNHTQISDLNISTVCSPSSGGYQCRCEDQYLWSCDQCLTFGACDNIMNNTCGCINTIPPDGQYCQSVYQHNFTACPVTTLSPAPTYSAPEYTTSMSSTTAATPTVIIINSTTVAVTSVNITIITPTTVTTTNVTSQNTTDVLSTSKATSKAAPTASLTTPATARPTTTVPTMMTTATTATIPARTSAATTTVPTMTTYMTATTIPTTSTSVDMTTIPTTTVTTATTTSPTTTVTTATTTSPTTTVTTATTTNPTTTVTTATTTSPTTTVTTATTTNPTTTVTTATTTIPTTTVTTATSTNPTTKVTTATTTNPTTTVTTATTTSPTTTVTTATSTNPTTTVTTATTTNPTTTVTTATTTSPTTTVTTATSTNPTTTVTAATTTIPTTTVTTATTTSPTTTVTTATSTNPTTTVTAATTTIPTTTVTTATTTSPTTTVTTATTTSPTTTVTTATTTSPTTTVTTATTTNPTMTVTTATTTSPTTTVTTATTTSPTTTVTTATSTNPTMRVTTATTTNPTMTVTTATTTSPTTTVTTATSTNPTMTVTAATTTISTSTTSAATTTMPTTTTSVATTTIPTTTTSAATTTIPTTTTNAATTTIPTTTTSAATTTIPTTTTSAATTTIPTTTTTNIPTTTTSAATTAIPTTTTSAATTAIPTTTTTTIPTTTTSAATTAIPTTTVTTAMSTIPTTTRNTTMTTMAPTTIPTSTTRRTATSILSTPPRPPTAFGVEMSVTLGIEFTAELNDATSPRYKELKSKIYPVLENQYRRITGFISVSINGFRKGSVITDFVVETTQVNSNEIAEANQKLPEVMKPIAPVIGSVSAVYMSPTPISFPNLTYTGDSMMLKCGPPPVNIHVGHISGSVWKFKGLEIKAGGRIKINNTGNVSVLTVNNIIAADTGFYECTLKGRVMDFLQNGTVRENQIKQAPIVQLQSQINIQCKEGQIQPLECCVQKPYTVQWFQGTTVLISDPTNGTENYCIKYNYSTKSCSTSQDKTISFICRVNQPHGYEMTMTLTIFNSAAQCNNNGTGYGIGRANDTSVIGCDKGQEGNKTATCQETGEWRLVRDTCIITTIKELLIESQDLNVEEVPHFVVALSQAVQKDKSEIKNSSGTISAIVNILNTISNVSTAVNFTVMQNVIHTVDVIIGNDTKESWAILNANTTYNASSELLGSMETLSDELVGEFNIKTERILLNRTMFSNSFHADLNSNIIIDIPNTGITNTFITTITFSTLNNVMPVRNSAFNVTNKGTAINAAVVLVKINATIQNITLSYNKVNKSLTMNPQCVFWNFTLLQNLGAWDDRGCNFVSDINNTVTCSCNHLTSFSLLMATDIPPSLTEALDIITYVGVGISLASLVICLIIEGYVWKAVTRNSTAFMRHVSIVNTALSLLIADICFIIAAAIANNPLENQGKDLTLPVGPCSTATFFMHFFYLALFFWMLVSGLLLFYRTVMVFSHMSKSTMLAIGFSLGYGCPLIIAAITVAVTAPGHGYIRKTDGCWLNWSETKALLALVIPALTIVFINILIVIVVLFKMLRRGVGDITQRDERHTLVVVARCVIILTPLFGLTWSLGVGTMVSSTNKGIHIAFAFFNSLQGSFILVFGTLFDSKICSILSRRLPSTISTHGGISSFIRRNVISRLRGRRYVYHVSTANSSSSDVSESFVSL
ncbi:uncharacterized threonine-rich GPI-anchored glycoprotein PJ4664.02-like [Mastacembelus armatus]|uniref:uncharacterized threonine-rich GPI-anchored glycoprotein PJ4664.02-like n=1 Tax=Mastacembelus armatus TaxID=205130 RepID=UPI000E4589DB|nr:uncharacterized threonine-rich GPI-anchored glycoprotein PJ4664.02-like [Mastacembelus armatus]